MPSPSDAAASVDPRDAAEAATAEGRAASARAETGAEMNQEAEPSLDASEPAPADAPPLQIGQAVRLRHGVRFLRSADPMPMLRPPDLVDREEQGEVQELRGLGRVTVRFRRGRFLIDAADLEAISDR